MTSNQLNRLRKMRQFPIRNARFVDQHTQDKDPAKNRIQIDW